MGIVNKLELRELSLICGGCLVNNAQHSVFLDNQFIGYYCRDCAMSELERYNRIAEKNAEIRVRVSGGITMAFECSATGEGPVFYTHGLDLPTGETLKFKSKKDMDDFRQGRPELSPDFVNEIVFDTPTPVQRKAIDDLYARSREQYQGSANISRTQILEALEKLK